METDLSKINLLCQKIKDNFKKKSNEESLLKQIEKIDEIQFAVESLIEKVSIFDVQPQLKCNGYRLVVCVYEKSLKYCLEALESCRDNEGLLWLKVATEVGILVSLCDELSSIHGSLLIPYADIRIGLQKCLDEMSAVYGYTFGFQHLDDLKKGIRDAACCVPTYMEKCGESCTDRVNIYNYRPEHVMSIDGSDAFATKIREAYLNTTVGLVRTMFGIEHEETLKDNVNEMYDEVAINKQIEPNEPINLTERSILNKSAACLHGRTVTLAPSPSSTHPLILQLLSDNLSEETSSLPGPDTIMFQVHGGGYVSESIPEQERASSIFDQMIIYEVSKIVDLNYSLSPQIQFPQTLDQCFYAYIWMLEKRPLGWTGNRIIFVGDSAGGNLITALCVKLIKEEIRKPDIIFNYYPLLCVTSDQLPSRLIGLLDPTLHLAFTHNCLMAYTGLVSLHDAKGDDDGNDFDQRQQHKQSSSSLTKTFIKRLDRLSKSSIASLPEASPLLATSDILKQFPFTYIFVCECDPLLDDGVEMARKLQSLNVNHELIMLSKVPHGILTKRINNAECEAAFQKTLIIMKKALNMDTAKKTAPTTR